MPIHEINERFTKSELYMMAWRSQEQHFHFKRKMKGYDKKGRSSSGDGYNYGSDAIIPEGLPDKFYAQEVIRDPNRIDPKTGRARVIATPGEINLSQVTGDEAVKYMASLGIHFPMMQGRR
jgi:hypothetical protein